MNHTKVICSLPLVWLQNSVGTAAVGTAVGMRTAGTAADMRSVAVRTAVGLRTDRLVFLRNSVRVGIVMHSLLRNVVVSS